MKEDSSIDIQKSIEIIDKVVSTGLRWMNSHISFIRVEFKNVFGSMDSRLINHLIDKWSDDNDFARFYLNMDMELIKLFFTYYSIPLSPDPFNGDDEARLKAQIMEDKRGFDIYAFESEIARLFYLFAYNNSLEILKSFAPHAFETVIQEKINLFGNGLNWSLAWYVFTGEDKMIILKNICKWNEP